MAKTSIFHDPRYLDFVERFHANPLRFAVSVCGMSPSVDQEYLLYAITPPNAKVSVVSGTSTGKKLLHSVVLRSGTCFATL